MKALKIILGILAILCSGAFFIDPLGSKLIFTYVISIFIGIFGIVEIVNYIISRKNNSANSLDIASGSLGLVLGILCVVYMIVHTCIPGFVLIHEGIIATIVWFFIIFEGVKNIVAFFTSAGIMPTGMRVLTLLLGILMIGAACTGAAFYIAVPTVFGILIGVSLVFEGVSLIVSAFED